MVVCRCFDEDKARTCQSPYRSPWSADFTRRPVVTMELTPRRYLIPLVLAVLTGTTHGASRMSRSHHNCSEMSPEQHPCFNITGLRQSPIYIDTCRATGGVLRPLRITQLDSVPRRMAMENEGEIVTAEFGWLQDHQPTISGGGLLDEFVLEIMELHWGADSWSGSEHVLDGRRFAGELHLGFRNTRYTTVDEALQEVDGLLGLAVLLDEDTLSPGHGITALVPGLFEIQGPYRSVELLSPPTLRELLPEDLQQYVQYEGSNTSGEQCLEVITWVVFLTPIRVLPVELETLRNLHASDGNRLCRSINRPLQPLSGRQLRRKGRTPGCPIRWPRS